MEAQDKERSPAKQKAAPKIKPRLPLKEIDERNKKRIRELITTGELPHVQLEPGNSPFLLDTRDLDRFIEARKTRL